MIKCEHLPLKFAVDVRDQVHSVPDLHHGPLRPRPRHCHRRQHHLVGAFKKKEKRRREYNSYLF